MRRSRRSTTISPLTTTTSCGWAISCPKLRAPRVCSGHRLLDVACGTGKSFLPMLERGWEVTACDISPSMLELARAKAGDAGRPLRGGHAGAADVRRVRSRLVPGRRGQLPAQRRGAGGSAERDAGQPGPGGLLMFDVNTMQAYRTFFAEEQSWSSAAGDGWSGAARLDAGRAARGDLRSPLRSAAGGGGGRAADPSGDAPPAPLPRSRGPGQARGQPAWSASRSTATASTRSSSSRSRNWSTQGRLHRPRRRLVVPSATL